MLATRASRPDSPRDPLLQATTRSVRADGNAVRQPRQSKAARAEKPLNQRSLARIKPNLLKSRRRKLIAANGAMEHSANVFSELSGCYIRRIASRPYG